MPGYVNVVGAVQSNAVWLRQLRLMCRSSITTETPHAGTCRGGNRLRLHIDVPHDMVIAFSDIDISFCVEPDFVRSVELPERSERSSVFRVGPAMLVAP